MDSSTRVRSNYKLENNESTVKKYILWFQKNGKRMCEYHVDAHPTFLDKSKYEKNSLSDKIHPPDP